MYAIRSYYEGCPHNCPGCHNPKTHDFNGGFIAETSEIMEELVITSYSIHYTKLYDRETTYEDIKNIKENTSIELEIFVHGALCISYSGQCLMSSLIGGRSGNRGTCAGSCRQKYNVLDDRKNKVNTEEYNLSTKDLNSLDNIGKLIEIGVDSFKIEGRMKSPEYVYLVVSLYRKAVDSYLKDKTINITADEITDLKKIRNNFV